MGKGDCIWLFQDSSNGIAINIKVVSKTYILDLNKCMGPMVGENDDISKQGNPYNSNIPSNYIYGVLKKII